MLFACIARTAAIPRTFIIYYFTVTSSIITMSMLINIGATYSVNFQESHAHCIMQISHEQARGTVGGIIS